MMMMMGCLRSLPLLFSSMHQRWGVAISVQWLDLHFFFPPQFAYISLFFFPSPLHSMSRRLMVADVL